MRAQRDPFPAGFPSPATIRGPVRSHTPTFSLLSVPIIWHTPLAVHEEAICEERTCLKAPSRSSYSRFWPSARNMDGGFPTVSTTCQATRWRLAKERCIPNSIASSFAPTCAQTWHIRRQSKSAVLHNCEGTTPALWRGDQVVEAGRFVDAAGAADDVKQRNVMPGRRP